MLPPSTRSITRFSRKVTAITMAVTSRGETRAERIIPLDSSLISIRFLMRLHLRRGSSSPCLSPHHTMFRPEMQAGGGACPAIKWGPEGASPPAGWKNLSQDGHFPQIHPCYGLGGMVK